MKGAIFDLGGVAVEWSNQTSYSYIEKRYGIPAADFKREAEREMPLVQRGELPEKEWMEGIFASFCIKGDPRVWGMTFESARFNKEVLAVICRLRRGGCRVATLSNLEPSRARWLRSHGIDAMFDEVVFSCEVGMRKPDLEPGSEGDGCVYVLTLKRLGVEARDCIFVDDNANCVAASKALGIKGMLFRDARKLAEDLAALGMC